MSDCILDCIIVDDEPIARGIVAGFVAQLTELSCVGQFKNAVEALLFLEQQSDRTLVFLDINMPSMSGLSMAALVKSKHLVIFTTAYAEHALQSYELEAVDYLLKPFTLDRFTQAVSKAKTKASLLRPATDSEEKAKAASDIYIKSRGENFLVSLHEIKYCEAQKNYTKVYLTNKKSYSTLSAISKFEEELNSKSKGFIRIHRSYIISRSHITSIGANFVMLDDTKIPIGPQYKRPFFNALDIEK